MAMIQSVKMGSPMVDHPNNDCLGDMEREKQTDIPRINQNSGSSHRGS